MERKHQSGALKPEAMYDGGYWQSTGIGRYVTARLLQIEKLLRYRSAHHA